jgi:RNA polymerase sigma factor (sigma-70 family)
MSVSSDISLWNAFRKGDKESFRIIYKKYVPALLNYGMKISEDAELVEDCIQDLFVELWNSGERLSSTSCIKFYLFKALRFKIYRNQVASHAKEMMPIEGFMMLLKSPSEEDIQIQHEMKTTQLLHLKEALETLPERQREAINLRYYHRFSNEEIAEIMNIGYNSAAKLIYAALKNLKESLKVAVSFLFFLLIF